MGGRFPWRRHSHASSDSDSTFDSADRLWNIREPVRLPHSDCIGHRDILRPASKGLASEKAILANVLKFACPDGADEIADELIDAHGSVGKVLATIDDWGSNHHFAGLPTTELIKCVWQLINEILRSEVAKSSPVSDSASLKSYLFINMAHLGLEQFRVVFLDHGLRVIGDHVIGEGGISGVRVDFRPILRRAVVLDSKAIFLVHNHPSGSSKPSHTDIEFTREFAFAAKVLEIRVIDHLIIARDGATSLRELGIAM